MTCVFFVTCDVVRCRSRMLWINCDALSCDFLFTLFSRGKIVGCVLG